MKSLVVFILTVFLLIPIPTKLLATSVSFSVPFENLIEKGYTCPPTASERQIAVSYEESDLATKWSSLIGGKPDSRIDITKEIVVFILYGIAPTTGYTLTVKDVKQIIYHSEALKLSTNSIVVEADITVSSGFAGQALTYPCAILKISRKTLLLLPQLPKPEVHWKGSITKPFYLKVD